MNKFDAAYNDSDGLQGGFFKKLKKVIKKTSITHQLVKKTRKIRSKVAHKTLPKKVLKVGYKIDKNKEKIAAVAAIAVATYFTGGAALGLMKGALMAGGKSLLVKGASAVAANQLKKKLTKRQQKKAEQAVPDANKIAQVAESMTSDPKMQHVARELLSQGYTPDEIIAYWQQSDAFRQEVEPEIYKTVEPILYNQYKQQGFTNEEAEATAHIQSVGLAKETVDDVQKEAKNSSLSKLLIPALGVGALLLTI